MSGITAHAGVISRAISQALSLLPPVEAPPAPADGGQSIAILFCAEHGFAGAFSERVLDAAGAVTADAAAFLVGTRGHHVAAERGVWPAWSAASATHADAIPNFANRLTYLVLTTCGL